MTGSGWQDTMYETMSEISVSTPLYFLGVILLGQYVLLNMVLAVMLDDIIRQAGNKVREKESRETAEAEARALEAGGRADSEFDFDPEGELSEDEGEGEDEDEGEGWASSGGGGGELELLQASDLIE